MKSYSQIHDVFLAAKFVLNCEHLVMNANLFIRGCE